MGSSRPTDPSVNFSRELFFSCSHSCVIRSNSCSITGSLCSSTLYSCTVTPAFAAWLRFMRIFAPFFPLSSYSESRNLASSPHFTQPNPCFLYSSRKWSVTLRKNSLWALFWQNSLNSSKRAGKSSSAHTGSPFTMTVSPTVPYGITPSLPEPK